MQRDQLPNTKKAEHPLHIEQAGSVYRSKNLKWTTCMNFGRTIRGVSIRTRMHRSHIGPQGTEVSRAGNQLIGFKGAVKFTELP